MRYSFKRNSTKAYFLSNHVISDFDIFILNLSWLQRVSVEEGHNLDCLLELSKSGPLV